MKFRYTLLPICLCFFGCNLTQQYIDKSENFYHDLNTKSTHHKLDSSTIKMRKVGKGEINLVLIHGFGPVPQIQWQDLVDELHNEFTLYIPDLIFFGESTSDYPIYDPRFQARQLKKTLEREGIEHMWIAGVSYGGLVAGIFAHEYADKTEKLILIDALSKFASRSHADSLARVYGYDQISEILLPTNGKALKDLFRITFHDPYNYPAFALNKPSQILYSNQWEHKEELLQYLFSHEEKIKNWDLRYSGPVTIIWGKEDKLIPLKTGYQLNEYYNGSEIEVIPDGAHVINMENAREVGEIIKGLK